MSYIKTPQFINNNILYALHRLHTKATMLVEAKHLVIWAGTCVAAGIIITHLITTAIVHVTFIHI